MLSTLFISLHSHANDEDYQSKEYWQTLADRIKEDPNLVIEKALSLQQKFTQEHQSYNELQAMAVLSSALVATSQFDHAETVINEGLARVDKEGSSMLKMRFLREQILLTHERGQWQQVIILSSHALVLAEQENMPQMIAHFLHNRSRGLRASSQNQQALADMLAAYQIAKAHDMRLILAEIVNSIALVHQNLGQFDEAIHYFKEALTFIDSDKDKFGTSILLYNIGTLYIHKQDLAQAKEYLQQSLALSLTLNDEIGIAYVHSQLATIAYNTGDYQRALNHIEQSLPVFEQAKIYQSITLGKLNLAKVTLAQGDHQTALNMLLALENDIANLNNDTHSKGYLLALARSYQKSRLFQQASEQYEAAIAHIEQTASKNNKESLQKIQTQMNIQHEQQKTELLKKENELQKQRIAQQDLRQKLVYLVASTVVALILVILVILFQQIRSRRKFIRLALSDELTGAPNRRNIREKGAVMFSQAKTNATELAVAVIDLDNFKTINDNFGHEAGDNVLKAFYQSCKQSIRASDNIGRIGGEEWLLIMPAASEQNITDAFKRIRQTLSQQQIAGVPSTHPVTFSMGAAAIKPDDKKLDDMIRRADSAVYKAKAQGRDQLTLAAI
ncbi:tetratricopeptide repeat-containing diguanylate cyclase [Thalassotalea euphylliae]|uniref:diguanylate cyclase n=1 Tax=Thalassotalea euphylliae TaxID=1655234 RepID=A0A3E0U440_9GAMM|nr:diguanylate cyclase [Thalassotalea euphylliae]REL31761.1 diguanylate cyclase [Thalassotalea euphylliae]